MQLSLTLLEILILMAGAIGLGITIHFFIVSKRNLKSFSQDPELFNRTLEEWKLRYFNDIEKKDAEIARLRGESENLKGQAEQLAGENDDLRYRMEKTAAQPAAPTGTPGPGFLAELSAMQKGLLEQNKRISQLLEQISEVKENEASGGDLKQMNEELVMEVEELRTRLAAREKELEDTRNHSRVSNEMSSMLDSAYREFNVLQEKIVKLETQLSSSQRITMEYEDLREGFFKASKDLEEQRNRLTEVMNENRQLQLELSVTNEKLREANFQRQQLQKRVSYLEELNQDLQSVAEANRRLESQLKRIGELESLLNVMAEERDQLARRQENAPL